MGNRRRKIRERRIWKRGEECERDQPARAKTLCMCLDLSCLKNHFRIASRSRARICSCNPRALREVTIPSAASLRFGGSLCRQLTLESLGDRGTSGGCVGEESGAEAEGGGLSQGTVGGGLRGGRPEGQASDKEVLPHEISLGGRKGDVKRMRQDKGGPKPFRSIHRRALALSTQN